MNKKEIRECEKQAKAVGVLLKLEREKLSMSKSELSQRSGLSRSAILRIETGDRIPSIATLLRLTKSLEVNLWEVIKEVES